MKPKMSFLQSLAQFFKNNWLRFILSIALVGACLSTYCILNENWTHPIMYVNGLFIGGAVSIFGAAMSVINLFGGMDIFSYYLNRKTTENGKEDLYEYSQRKKTQRMKNPFNFVPYLFIGALAIIASIIVNYSAII